MQTRGLFHNLTRPLTRALRRDGSWEWEVLAAIGVIVLAIWGFAEIADEVTEGETRSFDEWVMRHMRSDADPSQPVGPAWLQIAGRDLTGFGDAVILFVLILAVAGYLLIERKFRAMWLVLIATITGQIASTVMKELFARERPDIIPHLAEVSTASFPSGHSMMATVVYLTLGVLLMRMQIRRATKIYTMTMALLITAAVGLSRIYLGVHYPTDVLAGWMVGIAWALLCWLVASYLQKRHAVEEPDETTEEMKQHQEAAA